MFEIPAAMEDAALIILLLLVFLHFQCFTFLFYFSKRILADCEFFFMPAAKYYSQSCGAITSLLGVFLFNVVFL